jgi:hypothetical protein
LALLGLSFLAGAPFLPSFFLHSSNATTGAQLSISVAPSLMLASPGFNAIMTVQLLSTSTGTPVVTPSPIQVIITSGNVGIIQAPSSPLYIQAGQSYATENITSTGAVGTSTLTASAQGYLTATFTVTARSSEASNPGLLATYFAPGEIVNNNQTYPKMVVAELQTFNATTGLFYPQVATSPVTVYARSSDNATMAVSTAPFVIPIGGVFADFNLTSSFFPGTANITAQANGWTSSKTSFTSFVSGGSAKPPTPAFLVFNTINPSRVIPGTSYKILLNAQTLYAPITSAGANLTWTAQGANITSSTPNLNGTGYGWATFIASKQSGLENITATIKEGGIKTYLDNITVNAYLSTMSVLAIVPHPSLVTDYTSVFNIRAVYNNTGVANATITWTAMNGTLVSPPTTTNATGYATVAFLSGTKPGTYVVQAQISKVGYSSATENVNFTVVKSTPPPPPPPSGPFAFLYTKVIYFIQLWMLIPVIAAAAIGGFLVIRRYRGSETYYDDEE